MALAVTTWEHGGWTVLGVDGEVDFHTAERVRAALAEAAAANAWLIVDCGLLVFSDSSFLSALVAACQQARADNGALVLACAPVRLERKLGIVGLDQLIPVYPSVAAAAV